MSGTEPDDGGSADNADKSSNPSLAVLATRPFQHVYGCYVFALMGLALVEISAAWTMAAMGAPPGLVSLVTTASTLPIVLFIVPFGAWADLADRRELVIWSCAVGAAACVAMAIVASVSKLSPWLMLALVGVCGATTAMRLPALAASFPTTVAAHLLSSAMMLASIGTSVSRSLAALAAAAAFAMSGSGLAFAFGAAMLLVALVSAIGMQARPKRLPTPGDFAASLLELRSFTWHSSEFSGVLVRGFIFFLLGASTLGLLPVLVRTKLDGSAGVYMALMTIISVGALVSGLGARRLRESIGHSQMLRLSCAGIALGGATLALSSSFWLSAAAAAVHGAGWVNGLAGFTNMAQRILPDWIRARGMAAVHMALIGGVAAGSAGWGQIANLAGAEDTVLLSSALIAVLAIWPGAMALRLPEPEQLTLKRFWPEPMLAANMAWDYAAPAVIQIEYRIRSEQIQRFLHLMEARRRQRLRAGAQSWQLLRDAADPLRFVEVVWFRSLSNRLTHAERTTLEDYRGRESRSDTLQPGQEPVVRDFTRIS